MGWPTVASSDAIEQVHTHVYIFTLSHPLSGLVARLQRRMTKREREQCMYGRNQAASQDDDAAAVAPVASTASTVVPLSLSLSVSGNQGSSALDPLPMHTC